MKNPLFNFRAMLLLAFLFSFLAGLADDALPASAPDAATVALPVAPDAGQLTDLQALATHLLMVLAMKFPIAGALTVLVGLCRFVGKPLFTYLEHVSATDGEDTAIDRIRAKPIYGTLQFLVDLVSSIKLDQIPTAAKSGAAKTTITSLLVAGLFLSFGCAGPGRIAHNTLTTIDAAAYGAYQVWVQDWAKREVAAQKAKEDAQKAHDAVKEAQAMAAHDALEEERRQMDAAHKEFKRLHTQATQAEAIMVNSTNGLALTLDLEPLRKSFTNLLQFSRTAPAN